MERPSSEKVAHELKSFTAPTRYLPRKIPFAVGQQSPAKAEQAGFAEHWAGPLKEAAAFPFGGEVLAGAPVGDRVRRTGL